MHNRWIVLSEENLTISDKDIDEMEYWRWYDLLSRVQKNWEHISKHNENGGVEKINILDNPTF